jgi:hypothetical protein
MEEKSNDFVEIGLVYKIDDDDELKIEMVVPSEYASTIR